MESLAQHQQRNPVERLQQLLDAELAIVGTHETIMSGGDGIYLTNVLEAENRDIRINTLHEATIEEINKISPKTSLELETADSRHIVSFAEVGYTTTHGQEESIMVAVKYYDDEIESAGIECQSLLDSHARGFDTLAPIAIVRDDNDAYLITLLRPDIRSLDNANWAVLPGEPGFDALKDNLSFVARSLASLHAKGIFHGDAQVKNFARNDEGRYVVIDLERGCEIMHDDATHVERYNSSHDVHSSLAYRDLFGVWSRLNSPIPIGGREGNIFLSDSASSHQIYDVFAKHFLDEYLKNIEANLSPELSKNINCRSVTDTLRARMQTDLSLER